MIRACRDGFTADSGKSPVDAWEASKGAPEWWLTFSDPEDAINLSDKLTAFAHKMQEARDA